MTQVPLDPDAQLLEAMADGDRTALARLYDRHAPLLLALATRMLGAEAEAEDLVHDVLLEVWQRAGDYDPARGSVRTWLCMRTRSRALDRLRSRARLRSSTDGHHPALESSERAERADEPAEDPALTPDRRRVHGAMSDLPPSQREVLALTYFEGLSSAEIATRLGVPQGTVKSRVAAAMAKLRDLMRVGGGV